MGHYARVFVFKSRIIILDSYVINKLKGKGTPLACILQSLGKIQGLVKLYCPVVSGSYALRQAVVSFQRIRAAIGQ